ncbi:MAG TPA: Fis family transcriptional regulator [Cyanobacteria bacterium UBA11149]|nr:Fis family transcriptional regulator [Cyanobacteria bacterium UBA11366]HBK63402.1 Fis family transcriptional regulator [Cyanobacteria bacterium UBA11166]HBR75980.1 Fis family transcriptional regulator [Cyanobacteria bacterium UBA11159]HBS72429.1 Fis family transcriptional regulator [Cyanobacteria bacterium UBA11153]HBW91750.1 Fis family transcriptional regulator [Cyanobacteria bacterium UBA11149]HCA93190.1 Fis family transcriptional regulator [Cyanobacteria bacterium UBA9226]
MRLPRFSITSLVTFLIVLILNLDVGLSSVGKALDTHELNLTTQLSSGYPLGYQNHNFPLKSEVLAQNPDGRKAEADRLNEEGIEQYNTSQFGEALKSWQAALTIYQEIKDRGGEGAALANIGLAYHSLGNYSKAIEYYQQSLNIAREINNRLGEGQTLTSLGNTYQSLANYTKAIEYHQESLNIAREINNRLGEGQSLGNLGNAYQSLGDYRKAIEYHQQSLNIAREIKNRIGEGAALGNLGLAYESLGDYTKAIEYHQESLNIAREIKNRLGEGQSISNLGLAYYNLEDYTKAIEYYQQSLAISQEINDNQGTGIALNNLGGAFFKLGNLTSAYNTLIQAINVRESIREKLGNNDANKLSIFEEQARTYRILQQVLIAQNKTDQALEISERGRARAFVELLSNRLSPNSTSFNIAPPTIAQIKQTAQEQNATIVEYSIIYDNFKIENKQYTNESELYIWVIKPKGEVTFRKVDLKPLWQSQKTSLFQLVGDTRESIGVKRGLGVVSKQNIVSPNKRLQQLYQILIEPIADILPTKPNAHVIFIPQSSLFLVPFPALKDKEGNYLIDKYAIMTAPSIQVLELTHKQGTGKDNALIVGNPTMPSIVLSPGEKPEQLSPLPGAEKEANEIASLLKTQALIGNQATETVVVEKMKQAKIIHLATHGLLDDIRGLGSAIALTPSARDDGLLTAEEILDMKINAQLVILSACDTGRGKITGDGVVGLSRSLISAGVSSVIVSIWAVPDAPTAELMMEFYQNWQNNPDMAQSLRQAMLTTKEKHPNPIDWAAFTLIGES